MELPASGHDPVLMEEVLEVLGAGEGKTIVDCTLGRAGHAMEIARRLGRTGRLIGLDVDPRNLKFARERLMGEKREASSEKREQDKAKRHADKNVCPPGMECEVRLFHANFAELGDVLTEL